MNVRRFRAGDLPHVIALFSASVHGLAGAHYDARQRAAWAPAEPDQKVWRARIEGQQTLIAEDEGVLIGFISWAPNGHIDLLFTAPQHARKGIASALCIQVEAALSATGINTAFTEASLVARPFFEHRGFVVTEAQDLDRNGVRFRRYAMQKTLTARLPPEMPPLPEA